MAAGSYEPLEAKTMETAMHALGAIEDLDLDFASADRSSVVTALLARCCGGNADYWRKQQVGRRIAALLRLFGLSAGTKSVELSTSCIHAGCGEIFGFELPIRELASWVPAEEPIEVALAGGRSVAVRWPTGHDLARWRSKRPGTRQQAMRLMLDDLVVRGRAEIEDEIALSAAIDSHDPLVSFALTAQCPACGHKQDVAVDLEGLALVHFDKRQHALLHDVHRLAGHYGWSEQEVMAVPARRRAAYLAFIDGETR